MKRKDILGKSSIEEMMGPSTDKVSQQKITKVNPDGTADLTDPTGKITRVKATDLQQDPTDPTGKKLRAMVSPPENQIKPGAQVNVTTKTIEDQSPISGDQNHDEISKLLVKQLRKLAGL